MENFVLGIFQEQLAKYIIGFKKEQVNANLLNGKGEITNVELNCAVLNDTLTKMSPFVELERVHCSKLSFHVTSWTNLRKAPIVVDVEHVTATLIEPLHYFDKREQKKMRQVLESELFQLIRSGLLTTRGPYNLFDRIVDNLSLEIRSVQITFQPLGKFKTRRVGPWTPPGFELMLASIRVISVNEWGCEASPEECWQHNHQHRNHHHNKPPSSASSAAGQTLMIYKKISMEYQLSIIDNSSGSNSSSTTSIPLVYGLDNVLEVQVALHRRVRDAAILAVQFDCVIPSVKLNLPQHVVPLLAHALAGMKYCLAKDRGFVDPLKTTSSSSTSPTIRSSQSTGHEEEDSADEVVFSTVTESEELGAVFEEEQEKYSNGQGGLVNGEEASVLSTSDGEDDDSENDENEDDGDDAETGPVAQQSSNEEAPQPPTEATTSASSATSTSSLPVTSSTDGGMLKTTRTTAPPAPPRSVAGTSSFASTSTSTNVGAAHDRPAILLPNGVVIHEKISMSMAIHHAVIRGTYAPTAVASDAADETTSTGIGGHIQVVSKGVMAEAIWPKENHQKGGYLQASVAYVSIQERYGSRIRTLLVGGVQRDDPSTIEPVEKATPKRKEVGRDETFPLYETRSVRPNPIKLRCTFPEQAFGLKTTVDYIHEDEDISVLHELGVEHIEVVIDSVSWCRAARFILNEKGGGFDPRWRSGDWSDCLTTDMLLKTTALPLNLEEYTQPVKQLFLDENEFPSSDLFRVTARVKKVEARIPAAILDDVRSCDIIFKLEEAMLGVSSALPRTFLSGKIGSSINGDDVKTKSVIDFPNDPSDVAYQLENSPDPADRQRGIPMSRAISTFRLQLTLRSMSVSLIPIIPIAVAPEPQELLAPTEITMIICFEGEPPELESNLTRIVLFFSVQADRFDINFDFELVTSAIGTLACHAKEVFSTFCACRAILQAARPPTVTRDNPEAKIIKSLSGRRVRVRRQISQSRETGGISIAFCLQASGIRLTLWRQNVPYGSPLRSERPFKIKGDSTNTYMPLLRLLCLDLSGIEVGIEASFLRRHRRVVLKLCLSSMDVTACNLSRLLEAKDAWVNAATGDDDTASGDKGEDRERSRSCHEDFGMVRIARFGTRSSNPCADVTESVTLRIEEDLATLRTWSFAADMENESEVCCHVEVIEGLVLLILEALLVPAWCKADVVPVVSTSDSPLAFPSGSVGDLFVSLVRSLHSLVHQLESSSSAMNATEEEVDSPKVTGGIVDRFLRDLFDKMIPGDVSVILLRFKGSGIMIKIPKGPSSSVGYGILIEQAEFLGSFFAADGLSTTRMMEVLGQKQKTWSSVIPTTEKGLRQSVRSRLKLLYCRLDEESSQATETLIAPFECGCTYFKSKAFLSMAKDVVVENIERLDDFLTCLFLFSGACKELSSTLSHVLSTVRRREPVTGIGRSRIAAANPVEVACLSVVNLIRLLRDSQLTANKELAAHQSAMQEVLRAQQLEIMKMRSVLFKKERDRLNAIAVVSSQITGWLRIGSSQRIGQRGIMTWNLLPKWALLRRSLLLLYPSPTKPSASDVINMRGASLIALAGGRRHDIKRAFAIMESTGAIHLVVISSDTEYIKWVQELQKITLPAQEEKQLGDSWRSHNSDSDINCDGDHPIATQEPVPGIARRWLLTRTAKGSSQAVVDRGQQSQENESGGVQDELEGSVTGQRTVDRGGSQGLNAGSLRSGFAEDAAVVPSSSDVSQQKPVMPQGVNTTLLEAKEILNGDLDEQNRPQVRTRFAEVGQATRSRFGSAFQAARQKGRELRLGSGASTPLGGSSHGARTTLSGSSHGVLASLSGSAHGVRTILSGSRHGASTLGGSSHGARTQLSGSSHGVKHTLADGQSQESQSSASGQALDGRSTRSRGGWWSCTDCGGVNKYPSTVCENCGTLSGNAERLSSEAETDTTVCTTDIIVDVETNEENEAQVAQSVGGDVDLTSSEAENDTTVAACTTDVIVYVETNGENEAQVAQSMGGNVELASSEAETDTAVGACSTDGIVNVETSEETKAKVAQSVGGNVELMSCEAETGSTAGASTMDVIVNVKANEENEAQVAQGVGPLLVHENSQESDLKSELGAPISLEKDGLVPENAGTQESDLKYESGIPAIVEPPDSGFSLTKRLGNAVRNVSGGGKRGGSAADVQPRKDGLSISNSSPLQKSRGNLKSVETPPDAPNAIKLHSVTLNGPLRLPSHPIHGNGTGHDPTLLPSKRLNGCWIARAQHKDRKTLEQKSEPTPDGPSGEDKTNDSPLATGSDPDSPNIHLTTAAENDGETSSLPSKQDLTAASSANHSLREELSLETVFRVQVFHASSNADFRKVTEVSKTLSDFLELHTAISESLGPPSSPYFQESSQITRLGEMGNSLASSLGLSTLDTVRLTGTLLCGLLEVPADEVSPEYLECCSNSVCEFLNSMLDAFLPMDGLDALTAFLSIPDFSTKVPLPELGTTFSAKQDTPDGKKLFALSEVAMEQLVRVENQAMLATRLAWSRSISPSPNGDVSQIIYQPISRHFREAMYGALMKVMEERDESHARMIAAGVLHVHEMDQHEKIVRRLRLELEAVKKQESRNSVSEDVRSVAKSMQQDSEAELVSLCQQLASEISSRTSTSLEIVRLKESRKIEQENEAAERQALEDELKRTKELLAAERLKLENSRRQVLDWKESYETVVQSECGSNASGD